MTPVDTANTPVATAMPDALRALRILVLGYGNPGRQDDGLGPAAAAAIATMGWPGVTTSDDYQLVLEDAIQVAAHDIVWFVDAARDGDAPCRVQPVSPALDTTFTSHLLKPEALLAIAQQQFGKCPQAALLGIRGYEFDFLEGLSGQARANLACAVAFLRHRIGALLQVSQ